MRAKLIGLCEKQGVFEGKPYHSIKLHCIAPGEDKDFTGWRVLDLKTTSIKYDRLSFVVGRLMEYSELLTYVGGEIDIQFDDNKRIVGLKFEADNYIPADSTTASEPDKKK